MIINFENQKWLLLVEQRASFARRRPQPVRGTGLLRNKCELNERTGPSRRRRRRLLFIWPLCEDAPPLPCGPTSKPSAGRKTPQFVCNAAADAALCRARPGRGRTNSRAEHPSLAAN